MTFKTIIAAGSNWPYAAMPEPKRRSRALLTGADVEAIKSMRASGVPANIIAKRFSVHVETAQRVLRGNYTPRS